MSDFLPPVVARLLAETTDFTEKFGAANTTMSETEGKAASAGSAVSGRLGAGMAAGGAAVGAMGMELTHLGDGLEQAQKQLEAAGKAAGLDMGQLDEITKKADSSMENFGHTSSDTDGALQKLVQAGRPAEELTKDMALAADLAAAKHISLSAAGGLIAKVYGGNAKVLKEFGINLKEVADPQAALTKAAQDDERTQTELGKVIEENRLKHMAYDAQTTHSKVATEELRLSDQKLAEIQQTAKASTEHLTQAQADAASGTTRAGTAIDELSGKLKGQAAASVDTFGGKLEIAKVKVEDFAARVGTKIGPAMAVAGPAIGGLGMIIQSGLIPSLISGVGSAASFAVGMVGAGISAAGAALPVIIAWAPVILAIAAVGIAGYELYKHWDEVWGFVKHITSDAADWVKSHLELIALVLFAPFAPLILLVTHWDEAFGFVRNITSDAFDWLRNTVSSGIDDVVGFVASLPGRAVGALESLGGDIAGMASGAMASMAGAAESGVGDVVGVVAGLPGRAVNALGNLGGLLYNAGYQLIAGFLNGIVDKFDAVKNFVGGIASWISSHKGPIEYDRTLLTPHGGAIMDGLVAGMRGGMGRVGAAVSDVTDMLGGVGGMGGGGGGGSGSALATGGGGGAGGGNTYQLIIQTATGDIPDSTIRKIRSQLFELGNDLPPGSIVPAA